MKFELERFVGVPDEEIFAIGDVHGRADLLSEALGAIASTPADPARPRRVVLLGDLIDRGPASLPALDIAMRGEELFGFPVTTLMGNHEMMLALAVSDLAPPERKRKHLLLWGGNGGTSVLDELEAESGEDIPHGVSPSDLARLLGPARVSFLESLASHYRPAGSDVLFVHAGLNPWVPLDRFLAYTWQEQMGPLFDEDLSWAWIREPFLDRVPEASRTVGHHGLFVVHGHTPTDGLRVPVEEQARRDRLNLDTYAFLRGRLRYARISGRDVEVFDVGDGVPADP